MQFWINRIKKDTFIAMEKDSDGMQKRKWGPKNITELHNLYMYNLLRSFYMT